ncbi:MAG: hypothetical protein Tsb0034_04960 [Ekhidna sp.]
MIQINQRRSSIPILNDYIDRFWQYSYDGNLQAERPFIPEGIFEIIFELGDQVKFKTCQSDEWVERPRNFLGGLFDSHYQLELKGKLEFFGIRFKYGKFRHFVETPLNHFRNQKVSIVDVFGSDANEIIEQVNLLSSIVEREKLLSHFLFSKLSVHHKTNSIFENLASRESATYASCLSEACILKISERHLRRVFNSEMGMAPKQFFRLRRLNALLKSSDANVNLTSRAFELGYYDQAHFINDIKKLTGRPPSVLFNSINIAQRKFLV